METIEFILTYENGPQDFASYDYAPEVLESEESLFDFATQELNESQKDSLVKISTCVFSDNRPPDWFINCNGKLYLQNREIL